MKKLIILVLVIIGVFTITAPAKAADECDITFINGQKSIEKSDSYTLTVTIPSNVQGSGLKIQHKEKPTGIWFALDTNQTNNQLIASANRIGTGGEHEFRVNKNTQTICSAQTLTITDPSSCSITISDDKTVSSTITATLDTTNLKDDVVFYIEGRGRVLKGNISDVIAANSGLHTLQFSADELNLDAGKEYFARARSANGGIKLYCEESFSIFSSEKDQAAKEDTATVGSYDLCSFTDDAGCGSCVEDGGSWTALGCIPSTPTEFVEVLLRFALGIAGGIALLLMLFGAFTMTTAGGNPEKIQGGRETITAALTGLLVIIFATTIMQIIGVQILDLPGL